MSTTFTRVAHPDVERFLAGAAKELYIDGAWRPADSAETLDVLNPVDERLLASVAAAGASDVDKAVKAARKAIGDRNWTAMGAHQRTRVLLGIADAIEDHADELAELSVLEVGLPHAFARMIVSGAVDCFRYYAGWPTKLLGSSGPSGEAFLNYTSREPVGVCALIIPWNGPLGSAAWKLAPALACGNTMILKPAEQAPLAVVRLIELIDELDLPTGVVNLITGDGVPAGASLASHPGVDKVSFTGSTEVGRSILRSSADTMTRVTLELGGKSPLIVFDDADLDAAAPYAVAGFTSLSGQMCVAGSRMFVQRSIYDEFVARAQAVVDAVVVGDPFDEKTQMGPLISQEQLDRVLGYVDVGTREGATLLSGGRRVDRPGYFMPPTIFSAVRDDMRIAREEIFGPVVAVLPFDDEEEAVRRGNDTSYGLAASIWTRDLSRAHRIAHQMQAGTVWVNTFGVTDVMYPFGGYKDSGLGRELGPQSIEAFTSTKSVIIGL